MALRASLLVICAQALWTFMKLNAISAIFWPLLRKTDLERLLFTITLAQFPQSECISFETLYDVLHFNFGLDL